MTPPINANSMLAVSSIAGPGAYAETGCAHPQVAQPVGYSAQGTIIHRDVVSLRKLTTEMIRLMDRAEEDSRGF